MLCLLLHCEGRALSLMLLEPVDYIVGVSLNLDLSLDDLRHWVALWSVHSAVRSIGVRL